MHHVALLEIMAIGLCLALVFGFAAQRLRLSPIIGYLVAGFLVGPNSPGYVADASIAHQLAEVGVILLMFGVGLHFKLGDLYAVRKLAVPGAVAQSLVATLLGALIAYAFGFGWRWGLVLGMGMAVASTVVLMRVLLERQVLDTFHGHTAVGWLIVEDIFTVLVLVLVPTLAMAGGAGAGESFGLALLMAAAKLAAMCVLVLPVGGRVLPWLIAQVARTRSRELLTLTILASAIGIAVGSALLFGASVALGAFLAGLVVGKTKISHQAAAELLPMRDAFAVLFFVSVGMLFDPVFLAANLWFVLACLGVVLLAKPLIAALVVLVLGYSTRTALTVAFGLAQIGEFSFILAQQAISYGLFSTEGYSALVACGLISISLNPLLFGWVEPIEAWLRARPGLWQRLNRRDAQRMARHGAEQASSLRQPPRQARAIVVGFGPVGQRVQELLQAAECQVVVIELNMGTVDALTQRGVAAVYGDATREAILEAAGVHAATYLVITVPDPQPLVEIVTTARRMQPELVIVARTRFIDAQSTLGLLGVNGVAVEEEEVAHALAEKLRELMGPDGRGAAPGGGVARERA